MTKSMKTSKFCPLKFFSYTATSILRYLFVWGIHYVQQPHMCMHVSKIIVMNFTNDSKTILVRLY